ncbi:MAG: glycosyl hydrolase [Saprospiraceae bacterium]|nr:glycosyl hydrolase [Saprospiraceae bacterium]
MPDKIGKAAIAVSRANPDVVYANIESEGDKAGVYRSNDGGSTWAQACKDRVTITRAWYYIEIFPDPIDQEVVYVLNAPMLKSTDGGKTFSRISVGHGDTHDMWINPNDNQNIILADDGGAEITFNGGTNWSTLNNQPTAQFYRVVTDNRFPYHVYAGQQDNSSVAIASRTLGGGITERDWYPAAGCESAFLAFDPNNPEIVYGGCYQGYIEAFNHKTGESKDIMAYPRIGLGTKPSEQKYRFNWNAPIIWQPQNPKVIYHGAQKVLRTDDGGITWTEISPDLTRNDPAKQDDGGGPYTNEGAGGEIYNTIAYLIASPHQAGVLWAGSDCGLVHVTRDEGKSWQNVTPPGIGEALINAIEVSPHNPSAAYVVATKFKFDDPTPMVYYTSDWGKTWTNITSGIGSKDFVRVVREDRKKQGLLYAGTERGLYISFDNGKNWQKFQLNLPVVPITDLTIHDNDLIAATAGRAFWILDDLGAIQQSMGKFGDQPTVFTPKSTYLLPGGGGGGGGGGGNRTVGQNPPSGVIIDYFLPEAMDSTELTLQITDVNDNIIRTYKNMPDKSFKRYEGGPQPEPTFASKKGVNRFTWDFRRESAPGIDGIFINGDYRGSRIAPGDYKIRIITPKNTVEQTVTIVKDPRVEATPQDFEAQQKVLVQLDLAVNEVHNAVNQMRGVREQVKTLNASLKEVESAKELIKIGEDLVKKITEWEEQLIQPKQKTFQDVINFYNRLGAEMMDLRGRVDQHNPQVTGGAKGRMTDLVNEWGKHQSTMNKLVAEDIAKYNKMYLESNFPAINIPKVSKP